MSVSFKGRPAGQPSMTTPIPGPWDSPQVVILNCVPSVEPAIGVVLSALVLCGSGVPCPLSLLFACDPNSLSGQVLVLLGSKTPRQVETSIP